MGANRNDEIREIAPSDIDSINAMCRVPGTCPTWIMAESARVHRHVATLGVRTFGAFRHGKPIARMEIMPIDAAPLALSGDDLWVIRCLWVLDEAQGSGIARRLMGKAIELAQSSKGIAVVTYEDWMPISFFERFGFRRVDALGTATLLLLTMRPDAVVAFAPVITGQAGVRQYTKGPAYEQEFGGREAHVEAHVTAVFTGRCPWLMQSWRHWLNAAQELSDKVITSEIMIFTREDAFCSGPEDLYIDGVEYQGSPVQLEPFLETIRQHLTVKAMK